MDFIDDVKRTVEDRQEVYGSPLPCYKRIARLWSAILDKEVTPTQVAMCMVCLKLAREQNMHKRDNWIDIAGFAWCANEIEQAYHNQAMEELAPSAEMVEDE